MLKVHFIIPAFRSFQTIEACLHSISKQSYPAHLIRISVVENGPPDGIEGIVKKFSSATYYFNPVRGRSEARNYLLNSTDEDFIAYVDVDVILKPTWLSNCFKAMTSPFIAAVTGPVYKEGTEPLDLFRKEVSMFSTNGQGNILENPWTLGGINTAAVLFRTSALKRIGGFDCSLKRSEDYELTHRLLRTGFVVATSATALASVYWDRGAWEYFTTRFFQMGYYTPKIHLQHNVRLTSFWKSSPVKGFGKMLRKKEKKIVAGLMLINFFFGLGYLLGRLRFARTRPWSSVTVSKRVLIEKGDDFILYELNPMAEFLIIRNKIRLYNRSDLKFILVNDQYQPIFTSMLTTSKIQISTLEENALIDHLVKDRILIAISNG